jgi:hypothetical protein
MESAIGLALALGDRQRCQLTRKEMSVPRRQLRADVGKGHAAVAPTL